MPEATEYLRNDAKSSHTILFADLAGFTALTEEKGDEHAADVAEEFVADVRAQLPGHEADEVKTLGDAVMIHCDDAYRGLCLAVCMLEDAQAKHRALALHIGAHTGPAVRRGHDWFGATVNAAARIAALAAPGEALVSTALLEAAGELPRRATVEALGPRSLRGFRTRLGVHRIRLATGDPSVLSIEAPDIGRDT